MNLNKKRCIAHPADIVSLPSCKAETLTISDQHSTFLLTQEDSNVEEEGSKDIVEDPNNQGTKKKKVCTHSLVKLTLVPYHKAILGKTLQMKGPSTTKSTIVKNSKDPDATGTSNEIVQSKAAEDVVASKMILSFLSQFNYVMTSESGAEYSYYEATPKSSHIVVDSENDIAGRNVFALSLIWDAAWSGVYKLLSLGRRLGYGYEFGSQLSSANSGRGGVRATPGFKVELISPASDRQVWRARPSSARVFVHETPQMYEDFVKPYITSIVEGNSLKWLGNIISGEKEKERLLLDKPEWIMNIDTKWKSHPDPFTVPQEQWYGHEAIVDLYCLGIIKDNGVATIRDLRSDHLPMLESMLNEGRETIERIYGVPSNQVRVYAHYQPQFYHFHVHFTRIENEIGAAVERGHLVSDIIQDLQQDNLHYAHRTITYAIRVTDKIYQAIKDGEAEHDGSLEVNTKE